MIAMARAGIRKGAQIKTMIKTIFIPLNIPEAKYESVRKQWKDWVGSKTADEWERLTCEDTPIVSEETMVALKDGGFKATNHGKKLREALVSNGIHPILLKKAGAEWRVWAEKEGLGKRPSLPPRGTATRAITSDDTKILSESQLSSLRDMKDSKGSPLLHQGSQGRSGLTDALKSLGIDDKNIKSASKEWRMWAKSKGIVRGSSSPSSRAESVSESDPDVSVIITASSSGSRDSYELSDADKDYLEELTFTTVTSREDLVKAFGVLGIDEKFHDSAITGWKAHAESEGLTADVDI